MEVVGNTSGEGVYIVNLGAYDTRTLDPVYSLCAWRVSGVLVAVDEGIFKALLENMPCERALKERRGVTPRTVVELRLLVSFGMPKEPALLKNDIDSFDIFVAEAAGTAYGRGHCLWTGRLLPRCWSWKSMRRSRRQSNSRSTSTAGRLRGTATTALVCH